MENSEFCRQGEDRLTFGRFSFPVLPSLNYQLDGPDKDNPDRLFIEDGEKRFLIYLEQDGSEQAPAVNQETDYDAVTVSYHSRRLKLLFPLQRQYPGITMGYFHILLPGEDSRACAGSLCIAPPEPYIRGVKKFEDLCRLFLGLERLQNGEG